MSERSERIKDAGPLLMAPGAAMDVQIITTGRTRP
jgi:hypothetical protein